MAIVFPASPSVNETFTAGSITYKWDGDKWIGLGVTPSDKLIEGSNSLELDANNDLVYTAPGTLKVNSADVSGYIAEFNQTNTSNSGQILINSPTDGNSRPSLMDFARGGSVKFSVGMGYNDGNNGFLISAGGSLASGISNAVFRITPDGKTGIGNYAGNGSTIPTSLLEVSTNWDNGDVPMVHFIGANNEAPQSGTENISFQISDENSNVLHKVWNTGGGNSDFGKVYYAGNLEVAGPSNTSATGIGSTLYVNNAPGTIGLFLGRTDSTSGFGANDYTSTIRFNGADQAWGDISYYPTGDATGSFRFTRNGSTVSTSPNAVIGVGAVYFPGTDYDIANALDDYEEGVWTPSLLGSSSNPSYTIDTNRSQYVKVGQLVSATVDLSVTSLSGGSGQVYMSLPFTATDITPKPYAEMVSARNNSFFNGANNLLRGWTVENTNAAYIVYQSGNAGAETNVGWGTDTNTGSVRFCFHWLYRAKA